MPQITFEESKFDEIIRLVTKDGWYKGNAKAPADLPNYLLEPRGKTKPGIPTFDEEITAYRKGYAEGMAARQSVQPRQCREEDGARVRDRTRDIEFPRMT